MRARVRARYCRDNERKGLRARVRICVIAAVFKSGRTRVFPVASTTFSFLTEIFMSSRLIALRCQLFETYFRGFCRRAFQIRPSLATIVSRFARVTECCDRVVIAFYVASIIGIAQFLRSFRKVKRARVSAFYLLRGRIIPSSRLNNGNLARSLIRCVYIYIYTHTTDKNRCLDLEGWAFFNLTLKC